MLDNILTERLELIQVFKYTFQKDIEPHVGRWFRRGIVQRMVFKSTGLPRTGLNMKLCNEAIMSLGYTPMILDGWACFTKR